MSDIAREAVRLLEMLPEEDQRFACAFLKKLVRAWDPDFTQVTPEERARIEAAERSGFVADSDVNWDDLSTYAP